MNRAMPSGDDLYFVRAERGPVKIGRSFNVRERYKTLRCGSAYELSLLGTIEGGGWQEWLWHGTFGPQRSGNPYGIARSQQFQGGNCLPNLRKSKTGRRRPISIV